MSHPDLLPTGEPTVGNKRDWGTLPPENRLGVGVIGLHEGQTMLVALRNSGLCKPVAACDISEPKRLEASESSPGIFTTHEYSEMLSREDVKIVAIYTPDHLHAEHIEQAFDAGKHVICTKPLLSNGEASERLWRKAEETGCRLQVGQSTRFYEPFLRMRELFDEGKFGTIETIDTHYHHNMAWFYNKSPWSISETHPVFTFMSHPVDLIRFYMGSINEVHAVGHITELGKQHELRHPDCISVHVKCASGKTARAFGNYGMTEMPKGRSLIEGFLHCTEGTAIARYPDLRLTYTSTGGPEIEEDWSHSLAGYHYRHELKGMHYGEFCNLANSFARAIIDGTPNSPDLKEGIETVYVMDAIAKSLETGLPEKATLPVWS